MAAVVFSQIVTRASVVSDGIICAVSPVAGVSVEAMSVESPVMSDDPLAVSLDAMSLDVSDDMLDPEEVSLDAMSLDPLPDDVPVVALVSPEAMSVDPALMSDEPPVALSPEAMSLDPSDDMPDPDVVSPEAMSDEPLSDDIDDPESPEAPMDALPDADASDALPGIAIPKASAWACWSAAGRTRNSSQVISIIALSWLWAHAPWAPRVSAATHSDPVKCFFMCFPALAANALRICHVKEIAKGPSEFQIFGFTTR